MGPKVKERKTITTDSRTNGWTVSACAFIITLIIIYIIIKLYAWFLAQTVQLFVRSLFAQIHMSIMENNKRTNRWTVFLSPYTHFYCTYFIFHTTEKLALSGEYRRASVKDHLWPSHCIALRRSFVASDRLKDHQWQCKIFLPSKGWKIWSFGFFFVTLLL